MSVQLIFIAPSVLIQIYRKLGKNLAIKKRKILIFFMLITINNQLIKTNL